MAPSRHDWKIVDWDVKPQHNQPTDQASTPNLQLSFPHINLWFAQYFVYQLYGYVLQVKVSKLMGLEIWYLVKWSPTELTIIRFLSRMNSEMSSPVPT